MIKILLFGLMMASAATPEDSTGIRGFVYITAGNRMPAPGLKTGPLKGVRTTIYIFELTNTSQVVRQDQSPYYSAVLTKLVRQAESDDTGYFKVSLPPGHYSLFTKKQGLYYAGRMDEKDHIAPVEVLPGKMTKVECGIESDHRPVY